MLEAAALVCFVAVLAGCVCLQIFRAVCMSFLSSLHERPIWSEHPALQSSSAHQGPAIYNSDLSTRRGCVFALTFRDSFNFRGSLEMQYTHINPYICRLLCTCIELYYNIYIYIYICYIHIYTFCFPVDPCPTWPSSPP